MFCTYTRLRYQVSVYRTIGPLVFFSQSILTKPFFLVLTYFLLINCFCRHILAIISHLISNLNTHLFVACSGHCPPKWISIVDFFSHLVSPGSEMCHFYQTMELQSCDTPNTTCKPGYTCCSSTCLNKIVVCDPWYPHKVPDHMCLPKDVSSKNNFIYLLTIYLP